MRTVLRHRSTQFSAASLFAAMSLVFQPVQSQATVTFDFNYIDAPGAGFNAAGQVGADRRAGLAQAGNYISSILGSAYTANILLTVNGSVTADTTLANASSAFTASFPGNGYMSKGDVMLKILGGDGADPSPGVADGSV